MCLTSEIQTPITPLFMNKNIKFGYSFSYLERKEQCCTKIICVFKNFWFLHFHRLLNARVLYKIKRKFAFFCEYQIYFISLVENIKNSDVCNSHDEIIIWYSPQKSKYRLYILFT